MTGNEKQIVDKVLEMVEDLELHLDGSLRSSGLHKAIRAMLKQLN